MKISLNWLREFVDIPSDIDTQKLATLFTTRTAEIEHVENQALALDKIVVGQIMSIHPHPNADKLQITTTTVGKENLQIVCGATNIKEGMYVPVALIGAKVHWHGEAEPVTLKATKIRGIESFGMICAGEEIGLEEKSDGIYDLSPLKPVIGQALSELLKKNDVILTVDNKSLTHRPDLWGHYGIAREISAIIGKKLLPLQETVAYPKDTKQMQVKVEASNLCPRYTGVIMEGIKIQPSPPWLQNRLSAIGYRSINNIVDATNYIMAELGQPLHAFDINTIEGGIVVRLAKNGEKITTLDDTSRTLKDNMLLIADHKKALAVAGVMGGSGSEIQNHTTSIFIESANFHPSSVRKTSVQLGLRTEAVQRFEKSLDPHLTKKALDRVCSLIMNICPSATIASALTDIKNFEDKKIIVKVNLKRVFSKIGIEIPSSHVIEMLHSLEFKAKKLEQPSYIEVEIPSFRATKDVSIEDDLVEEIARMYGYENIPAQLPKLPITLPIENTDRKQKHLIRQFLAQGLGFNEVYNYSFYSKNDSKKALIPEEPHIKVKNYLSEDQTHLRISLLPNILKNVQHNLKFFPEIKLFEIGRTYEDLQEYFPIEEKKIIAISVKRQKNTQTHNHLHDSFYEMKGAVEALFEFLKIEGLDMRHGENFCPYAHPNKYIQYCERKSNQEIAKVYELHPLVAKNYDLEKNQICVFEVNFTKLMQLERQTVHYQPIPKFPGIEFDISVVIDKKTEIGTLGKLIKNTDRQLIREIKLFDIYEGQNIPPSKKALAFKINLQARDRTLTDEEMKKIQQKIFEELIKKGGEIRGLKN